MYKIEWDRNCNGILLKNNHKNVEAISSPRPVFFEELDLLGLNKFWKYPKSKNPLLWATGRRYYYKGVLVAEVKGGNIFEHPTVFLTENGKNLELDIINTEKIVEKNRDALFVLENEAMDFIEHTYKVFKNKVDFFTVAFSGGKDSQVMLDLVTRVIPPDELIVIFSDTTMEISYTYESVENTKKEYQKKYPELKFYITKPPKPAIEFWKEFGPPSRIHRWCCTVTKTAPFAKKIKDIFEENIKENRRPKIVIFDGVRSKESQRRGNYCRLSIGTKHILQINAEVIRNWNLTEVFLYNFYRNLNTNCGYRFGLNRIGCSICPFASGWSEYILSNIQKDLVEVYIKRIKEHIGSLGIKEQNKVREYITQGQWKKRAGGEGVNSNGSHLEITSKDTDLIAIIKDPSEKFLEWVKVIGDVFYKQDNTPFEGEIRVKERIFPFQIMKHSDKKIIKIHSINDAAFESKIKRVFYKSTYCIHCGACEVECPTSALKATPEIKVNSNLCTHCGNCIYFAERGCLVAKSLQMAKGGLGMNRAENKLLKGFGRYLTFGLRDEWLSDFLNKTDKWLVENNLGNKQVESMKAWLMDAELIDKSKNPMQLTNSIKEIYLKNKNISWELIWVNLYYNSSVCKFFVENIDWNETRSVNEVIELVKQLDDNIAERTVKSGISSLFQTFEHSPLGKELRIGIIEKKGRERIVKKLGTDDIHPLTVAYSLYKAAEYIRRRDFTVSELYTKEFNGGPYKLFGISREKLERILRGLQEYREQILKVDLVADLDNIYLRDDLSSLDIIKILKEGIKL